MPLSWIILCKQSSCTNFLCCILSTIFRVHFDLLVQSSSGSHSRKSDRHSCNWRRYSRSTKKPRLVVENVSFKCICSTKVCNSSRINNTSFSLGLSKNSPFGRWNYYKPVYQSIDAVTNILFSSGTTGK